jgi:hypothetical protein
MQDSRGMVCFWWVVLGEIMVLYLAVGESGACYVSDLMEEGPFRWNFAVDFGFGSKSRELLTLEKRRSVISPEKSENVVVKRIDNPATDWFQ